MAIDGREEEAFGKGERKEETGIGTSMGDEEMGRQGTNEMRRWGGRGLTTDGRMQIGRCVSQRRTTRLLLVGFKVGRQRIRPVAHDVKLRAHKTGFMQIVRTAVPCSFKIC